MVHLAKEEGNVGTLPAGMSHNCKALSITCKGTNKQQQQQRGVLSI
jgi:hypothetical protein